MSFVRILQRCPHFSAHVFDAPREDPSLLLGMEHAAGIAIDPSRLNKLPNRIVHDPHNYDEARSIAAREDVYPVGLLYRDERAVCYDDFTSRGLSMTQAERQAAIRTAIDRFAI